MGFSAKRSHNDDLNKVTNVFGPSLQYLINMVPLKIRSFLRKIYKKTQFPLVPSVSRLPETASQSM